MRSSALPEVAEAPLTSRSDDARLVDVEHLGRDRVIGAWVVDEEILVDPGPAISIPRLVEKLGEWRPRAIALTHIHLDHAGAAGTLVRHWPGVEVWVDERGAPHLADPERLLRSAGKIYGDRLEELWGRTEPVPEEAIRIVRDGERHGPFVLAYTPGHADHHVSYLHEESRTAYVGDVAGVRIGVGAAVIAPTVPPEFDPDVWRGSLRRVGEWRPEALAVTHFGRHTDVEAHLAATDAALGELVATEGDPERVERWVSGQLSSVTEETAAAYEQAAQPRMLTSGIGHYLSRREEA